MVIVSDREDGVVKHNRRYEVLCSGDYSWEVVGDRWTVLPLLDHDVFIIIIFFVIIKYFMCVLICNTIVVCFAGRLEPSSV